MMPLEMAIARIEESNQEDDIFKLKSYSMWAK